MPGLNSNPSDSNSSACNGITGDKTPPHIAYYLNSNTGEVEMVLIPEGAPLPHDPRAASWGFIDWNKAFRAAIVLVEAGNTAATGTSVESSQDPDQDKSVDDTVFEETSQTQQD
ncbi:hypothetical protein K435DRAFT_864895 [Dendrothele bispora CBS 962.96]|uniref:Uncharacterized protein n=1 Tax=Dendrothele bispora (strain CBS 962.96) TaxID=1314807 RepID=A0A4S8LLK3_DENBC|nr:hypothetical protein K435DRAFT_864895 [Dendrothele bispora CBS 962.96]